jgi:hypothetical protein
LIIRVAFGAIVVSEFNYSLPVCPRLTARHCVSAIECEEIKIELCTSAGFVSRVNVSATDICIRILDLVDHFHTEKLIELNASLGIFDTKPALS